ncbi:MAG: hypothetical protein ACRDZ3_13120 [Acidimicrobiia bacterium]
MVEGALFTRRNWPTAPDGFHIAVPTGWEIPGAGAIPTTANKNLREGGLQGAKATVAGLIAGEAEPVGALFRTSGPTGNGAELGVAVGIFDVGHPVTVDSLRQEISEAEPASLVEEVAITRLTGLKMTPPLDADPNSRRVVSDYWVPVPHRPEQVAMVRFWGRGAPDDETTAVEDFMIGAFSLILPAHWSGVQRPAALHAYKPAQEGTSTDRAWRLGGWRLGQVFETAPLLDTVATSFSRANARPRDVGVVFLVFAAWLVAVLILVGFQNGTLIAGTAAALGAAGIARKSGKRAAIGLAVVLVGLLALGLALDSSPKGA